MATDRIESVRIAPDNSTVLNKLGLLAELAGTWEGRGFNLIARPDFSDRANLYLQLNQTHEVLKFDPIGSAIPNRGFGQGDIELFGLHYLQKISDVFTGGALHIEPGIWITQPTTTYPPETAPNGGQIVARMASIPHGNALLAQGVAGRFEGPPTLKSGGAPYAFSTFPSFNSTPFPAAVAPASPVINAASSSEKATATAAGVGPGFSQYDLTVAESGANPRTPFNTSPADPPLPASINGVPMQEIVNDPIALLQQVVTQQAGEGCAFQGVSLNIATQKSLTFFSNPNSKPGAPTSVVNVADGAGGIENIPFLEGGEPTGASGANAQTALVYATFWIERVIPKNRAPFMQLQYAQTVVLNFPIFTVLNPTPPTQGNKVSLGWPHISVATLRKSFN